MVLSCLAAAGSLVSALSAPAAVALKQGGEDARCPELDVRLDLADTSVQSFAKAKFCSGITSDPATCATDCSKFYSSTPTGFKLCVANPTTGKCSTTDPGESAEVTISGITYPQATFTCPETASPPAPTAMTYNDPHIRTLSGNSYDIHGVGVFEYASTPDVQSQVYICPVAKCTEGVECMSFITSLVVKTKTHTLVASGDSVTVDGMAPQKAWEHGMNHTLENDEGTVTSVGKHDPNAKLMRVSAKELLKPKACQPDHKSLKMNSWVWHYCSPSGWHISTPDLTLRVGVVGPYEEGYLREVNQDRSLNLAVTPGNDIDLSKVKGIINGDRNRYFEDYELHATDKEILPDVVAVTSRNVADHKVLFPKELKKALDSQCGGAKAMHLKLRAEVV